MHPIILFLLFTFFLPSFSHAMKGDEEEEGTPPLWYDGNIKWSKDTIRGSPEYHAAKPPSIGSGDRCSLKRPHTVYTHEIPDHSSEEKPQLRYLIPIHTVGEHLLVVEGCSTLKTRRYLDAILTRSFAQPRLNYLAAFLINPHTKKRVCDPQVYKKNRSLFKKPPLYKQYKCILPHKSEMENLSSAQPMSYAFTLTLPSTSFSLKNVLHCSYSPDGMLAALIFKEGGYKRCEIVRKIAGETSRWEHYCTLFAHYSGFVRTVWNPTSTLLAAEETTGFSIWDPSLSTPLIIDSHLYSLGGPRGICWDTTGTSIYMGYCSSTAERTRFRIRRWDLAEEIYRMQTHISAKENQRKNERERILATLS